MITEYEKLIQDCPALKEARLQGIDVYMLLDNLKRTPAQRLARHRIALQNLQKFHKTAD
jgi:hypothetical protein